MSASSLDRLLANKPKPGYRSSKKVAPRILSPEEMEKKKELLRKLEAIKELSRRSLLRFTEYTEEGYHADWFHKILCTALDKFLQDVVEKKSPRLIVLAPPRHGKSELVSRRFTSYVMGRYPDMKIIATSYGSSLAEDMNRDVQRIVDSQDYRDLFPATKLAGPGVEGSQLYVRTHECFEIVKHKGVYKNAGVLGQITGKGGDILICDDPVKDYEDAYSDVMRNKSWNWFVNTFMSRADPGAGVLIIMTRWHEDDIVGRLLEKMKKGAEQWDVLCFPAIAEEDEEFRKKGDALCPSRYPLAALERIKSGSEDIDDVGCGSRAFNSLYQQRPSSKEGETFKRENWIRIKLDDRFYVMEPKERRRYMVNQLGVSKLIQTWDTAIGGKKKNDFAACTTLGITKDKYIVFEVWKDKIKYPEMREELKAHYDAWLPDVVVVEGGGAAAGKAVVQDLRPETRMPLKEISTVKDKEFRADMLSPTHEAKRCYIPEGVSWASSFIDSAAKFPAAKNDDDLDSWMLAMEEARGGPKPLVISDELLAWSAQPGRR